MRLGDQLAEKEAGEEKHPAFYIIRMTMVSPLCSPKGIYWNTYSSTLPNGHMEVTQPPYRYERKALQQNGQHG